MQERIKQIKASEEVGVKYMQAWEERILDMNEARQEGREEGREEIILNALKKGKKCNDIAEFADLDLTFVLEVAKKNGFSA
jgi:predicted transposase YdaD